MTVTTRLLTVDDAAEMAEQLRANREFLAPWDPDRSDEYFTEAGQRRVLADMLRQHSSGSALPHAIVENGRILGRIALTNIARGPFLSGTLGYWVAHEANGRGVATAAVARIVGLAFTDLGLHRVEAGTLVNNIGSQRVLENNKFQRYGLAPRYLWIAGAWRDHVLFQRLADD
ncbi:GNAT family N-acetyltransferase [Actinoplanes sp. TRM 88003]|uniref:GNAT family N-acetyltransferase n=1 Tax=Paractinoplanes aksuensis TaxID=2939490 RepID=A0ABT1DME9_9ACTN|nr:GNAT family protein [Actinoplanes aksuensis]MCO8272013.1 GNAT family N-acetyltransferase [Actinoplanes aksuensis]